MDEKGGIAELKMLRNQLLERVEELESEYRMCGHHAICNRISETNDIISMIQNRVFEISPADCDW